MRDSLKRKFAVNNKDLLLKQFEDHNLQKFQTQSKKTLELDEMRLKG